MAGGYQLFELVSLGLGAEVVGALVDDGHTQSWFAPRATIEVPIPWGLSLSTTAAWTAWARYAERGRSLSLALAWSR